MDFARTASELDRFVRGMTPWPSAWTVIDGKRVKVLDTEPVSAVGEAGRVLRASAKEGLVDGCADGGVRLTRIQPEGRPVMSDTAWLAGHGIEIGTVLE